MLCHVSQYCATSRGTKTECIICVQFWFPSSRNYVAPLYLRTPFLSDPCLDSVARAGPVGLPRIDVTALVWGMDRQKGIGWNVRCAAGAFFGRLFWSFSIKKKTNSWDQNFSVKSRSVCLVVCLSSGLSVVRSVCLSSSTSFVGLVVLIRLHPSFVRSVGRPPPEQTSADSNASPTTSRRPTPPPPPSSDAKCWVPCAGSARVAPCCLDAGVCSPRWGCRFYSTMKTTEAELARRRDHSHPRSGITAILDPGSQPSSILPGWF